LLQRIVGRRPTSAHSDGRRVPGILPHLLKDFPAVRRFQVIQDEPDRVELRVVLGRSGPKPTATPSTAIRSVLATACVSISGPSRTFH
jgi:hypothetical protein